MTFHCPRCGITSHNPNDEHFRYCANCHGYVDDRSVQDLLASVKSQPDHTATAAIAAELERKRKQDILDRDTRGTDA